MNEPDTRYAQGVDGLPDGGVLEPIAIVGLGFRFPGGAVSDGAFWEMMVNKQNVSTEFPADRLNIDGFYNADLTKLNTVPLSWPQDETL